MTMFVGGLILAFVFMACTALGAGVAWFFVRKSKKSIYWSLTPVFALLWFFVTAVPLVALGFYLPMRARMAAPPPPVAQSVPVAPAPAVEPIDNGRQSLPIVEE